jgi:hypothetical protein
MNASPLGVALICDLMSAFGGRADIRILTRPGCGSLPRRQLRDHRAAGPLQSHP